MHEHPGDDAVTATEPNRPLALEGLRCLWSHEEITAGIDGIADRMLEDYAAFETVNLVPVMTGGMHFTAALTMALERRAPGKWLIAPIFAAAYLTDGDLSSTPAVEFPTSFEARIESDAPVVIIDDLLDSGTTMAALIGRLQNRGMHSVALCVLMTRIRERTVDIHPDYCAFEVPTDAWLVGFGMDSDRRFRGLDAIYAREP